MSKLPSMQFYPADWRKDPCVQVCSFKTRGIWFEMLCVMFECTPRGYFTVNGRDFSDEEAARLIGCSVEEYKESIVELTKNNVLSRDCHGIIYNRRMVKDQKVRDDWSKRQRSHRNTVTQESLKNHALSSSSSSSSSSKSKTLSSKPDIPYQEIINDLNQKAGKKFKAGTDSTIKHINARWAEGFRLEDFKHVNSNKSDEWKNDKKMEKYLAPDTLYSGKFDRYLNENAASTKTEEELCNERIEFFKRNKKDRSVGGTKISVGAVGDHEGSP